MIISLTGPNSYLALERLNQLRAQFIADRGELAVERIDASDIDTQVIFDAVSSLPFLTSKKMVVVSQLGTNKSASEKIEQIISATESSTELIIYEPLPDRRTSFYKSLKTMTKMEEFKELDAYQLATWLVEKSHKLESKISHADANYLLERVGLNQSILSTELEKLSLYEPRITRQNIDLLTDKAPQSKIFDLLDAAFSGNKQRALELYEDQQAQRVEPQTILALIVWQLHLLALAKYGANKSSGEIASEAKLNPYPIAKAEALARKITQQKLVEMVDEVAEIDLKSKTSAIDIDEALKNLVITL